MTSLEIEILTKLDSSDEARLSTILLSPKENTLILGILFLFWSKAPPIHFEKLSKMEKKIMYSIFAVQPFLDLGFRYPTPSLVLCTSTVYCTGNSKPTL